MTVQFILLFSLVFHKLCDLKLCSMNVVKRALKAVGIICVPIAFIDGIGTIGFVEGTSMEPTLKDKDIIWQQRWFFEPREGQIFTFTSPRSPDRVYIKRLAKRSGRQVQWKNGKPFIVPPNHYWMLADNPSKCN
ncbi:Mitochondrial inner membrane protease subunit 2 [Aphelenchoides bicaudatus]|nr:Mitochondrial inner membrane protease subunit 2 [Aphelenchoides bicaudatus]